MSYVKIEANAGLVRDTESNAVLNTDSKGLANYRRTRELNRQKAQSFDNITTDIDNLKKDIEEIKDLLLKIARD